MVDECLKRYFLASIPGKNEIIDDIVQRVHEGGGRFLRRLAGRPDVGGSSVTVWEMVSTDEARKKVSKSTADSLGSKDRAYALSRCSPQ